VSVFPDQLGFGKTPSRFSDPRRRDAANIWAIRVNQPFNCGCLSSACDILAGVMVLSEVVAS
jgi:hypothetical protein